MVIYYQLPEIYSDSHQRTSTAAQHHFWFTVKQNISLEVQLTDNKIILLLYEMLEECINLIKNRLISTDINITTDIGSPF